jgi:hypothetical protein
MLPDIREKFSDGPAICKAVQLLPSGLSISAPESMRCLVIWTFPDEADQCRGVRESWEVRFQALRISAGRKGKEGRTTSVAFTSAGSSAMSDLRRPN